MKRIMIGILLLAAMLAGMMSVHAAEAEMTVQVRASETEVQVGDTVEYTVLATGSGVVAMQFVVQLPEGLRYVPNSAATPENLAKKLGVAAADWTEISMMFTFYNDLGINIAAGTELLRFSCVAEKEGNWDVELFELLPFNSEFLEFAPTLQVQTVKVTKTAGQTEPTTVTGETVPAVTVLEDPVTPTDPDPTDEWTQPSSDLADPQEQVTDNTVEAPAEPVPDESGLDIQPESDPEAETQPVQDEKTEEQSDGRIWLWVVRIGGMLIIAGGVAVYLFYRKKSS